MGAAQPQTQRRRRSTQDRILKRLNKKIEILVKQFTQLTKIKQPMERIQENVRDTRIDFVEEKNR